MPRFAENLIGQKFGRLTVVDRAPNDKSLHANWVCKCSCGNTKVVGARHLKSGNTISCGCYAKERSSERNTTHGMSNTRLFHIWTGMNGRCYCHGHNAYSRYGGRGIGVCDEWRHDFEGFYNWAMSTGYDDSLSIDRINNDKGYEPSNCRWATPKQQANNRRNNRRKPA